MMREGRKEKLDYGKDTPTAKKTQTQSVDKKQLRLGLCGDRKEFKLSVLNHYESCNASVRCRSRRNEGSYPVRPPDFARGCPWFKGPCVAILHPARDFA